MLWTLEWTMGKTHVPAATTETLQTTSDAAHSTSREGNCGSQFIFLSIKLLRFGFLLHAAKSISQLWPLEHTVPSAQKALLVPSLAQLTSTHLSRFTIVSNVLGRPSVTS